MKRSYLITDGGLYDQKGFLQSRKLFLLTDLININQILSSNMKKGETVISFISLINIIIKRTIPQYIIPLYKLKTTVIQ